MHFFPLPMHSIQVQWFSFAYSRDDSVQNNLGIVIDVIRKMIKHNFFFFCDVHSPSFSQAARSNTNTDAKFPFGIINFTEK